MDRLPREGTRPSPALARVSRAPGPRSSTDLAVRGPLVTTLARLALRHHDLVAVRGRRREQVRYFGLQLAGRARFDVGSRGGPGRVQRALATRHERRHAHEKTNDFYNSRHSIKVAVRRSAATRRQSRRSLPGQQAHAPSRRVRLRRGTAADSLRNAGWLTNPETPPDSLHERTGGSGAIISSPRARADRRGLASADVVADDGAGLAR